MFDKDRYITRGIKENLHPLHYLELWNMIDAMEVEQKDYLQVFKVSSRPVKKGHLIEVDHVQESPPYRAIHRFYSAIPTGIVRVFVIDEGERSTMLLANEY